jgi:acetyl-CoA C-acetyltransferase
MAEAFVIDGVRTPRGKGKESGALHGVHPQELLAQTLNAQRERLDLDPLLVEDVIVGNGSNEGDHGQNIGRLAVLAAGWPAEVPGTTVNRFCGSGQQAVMFAAQGVASGFQDLIIAGGVESTSRWGKPSGVLGAGNVKLRQLHPMVHQGISADLIATLEGFSREAVDEFALSSHTKAEAAVAENRFQRSLFTVRGEDGTALLDHDEHVRPGTTAEDLARLRPAFSEIGESVDPDSGLTQDEICEKRYPAASKIDHVHHAGNSSARVDGAAVVVVASEKCVKRHGFKPRARIVSMALAGTEPVIMLTAPVPASVRCLEHAGMSVGDIDLWEINEAFASVALKVVRDLNLDPQRVNVNGGAIALGHPIGASGAILIQTLLDELERRDLETGLVTMCTGGGMATATIIQRVESS